MGKTGNTEQDEHGLLPYPVIIAATKGDPEAMQIVVHHYDSYIEQKYQMPDSETRISIKTLVYQKGVDYIRKILETA